MVVHSLGKQFREARLLPVRPLPKLVRVLFMDAVLYITASAIVSVMGILAEAVFLYTPLLYLQVACNPMVVVTGQRVVVNLRSMKSQPFSRQVIELNLDVDSSLIFPDVGEHHPPSDQDEQEQDVERSQGAGIASGIEMIAIEQR